MITLLTKLFIKNSEDIQNSLVRKQYGSLCSIVGIVLNVFLFLGKYIIGTICGSIAIVSDAFNNLSDAGSSIMTLVGFQVGGKKADPEHPFGHGRLEYVSGFIVSMAILLMGLELGKNSIIKIFHPEKVDTSIAAIIILIVSIMVKLYMAFYNNKIGKKIDSAAMRVNAIDSMSDSIATTVVLVSVLVLKFVKINIDGICGVLVATFILYSGYNAAKETLSPLLGHAAQPEFVEKVKEIVMSYEHIVGIHDLVVHDYGPGRLMLSLHAEVPGDVDIFILHDEIDQAEGQLEAELQCDAVIHMDPIVVGDEEVNRLKAMVEKIVNEIDEVLSIHDFRVVEGPTHTNLIFDVVVPAGYKDSNEVIMEKIKNKITEYDNKYFAVIKVEKSYV